ncbi:undecaprenyldiphospho-muramoylpentapeptide beta-N- acetylglucosaminyltransferase [compost metagenome]
MGHDLSSLAGKRILFRADGSWEIGLGHVFRTKAMASAMKRRGCDVAVMTLEDTTSLRLFEQAGLPCFAFGRKNYPAVRELALAEFQPDLVVLDILQVDEHDLLAFRSLTAAKIVTLDDVGAGLQLGDAVINAIVFHWEHYDAQQAQARLFEGPAYMILQDEVSSFADREPAIRDTANRVLIALGGTDTRGVTAKAIQALDHIAVPLEIRVNLGPGCRLSLDVERVCDASPHHVTLLRAAPSLLSEFWQSDLVVCGGGSMLYELAAMGIPSVAIATEPHEQRNIQYWARTGTTLSLGTESTIDPFLAGRTISDLLASPEQRRALSAAGKASVDGGGIERVQEIFSELLAC